MKKTNRPFSITGGLHEGYDLSRVTHTLEDARTCIESWMGRRLAQGKKIITGNLMAGEFIYPDPKTAGAVMHEPSFSYQGRVREDATDEEAAEMLTELADELAAALGQERVHATFGADHYICGSDA